MSQRTLAIAIGSLILLALLLKVALLLTSQSMADGDEAVEGIMAMHVLERGVHPVYPYGIRYGAGVFAEVHLAALIFRSFGVSDVALKSAGLIIWTGSLLVVTLIGRRYGGTPAAGGAALLFAFSPQAAEWSMKVAGGHQVAVLLALIIVLLLEHRRRLPAVALAPLAAIAHPIVAPLAAAVALAAIAGAGRSARLRLTVALALSASLTGLALWPRGAGVWDPSAGGFELLRWLRALPAVALTFFSPNVNATALPEPPILAVSLLWLGGLGCALATCAGRKRLMLYTLAPLGVVVIVDPNELAARHLMGLYPIACLLMGIGLPSIGRRGWGLIASLALTGAVVQVAETRSPYIHGPRPQDRGVERRQVEAIIERLDAAGIEHVYCLDPMLQWNIMFESRERIVARWRDPLDRFPEYPERVDRARLAGLPVALIGEVGPVEPAQPQSFRVVIRPDPARIEAEFPRSPRLRGTPGDHPEDPTPARSRR